MCTMEDECLSTNSRAAVSTEDRLKAQGHRETKAFTGDPKESTKLGKASNILP